MFGLLHSRARTASGPRGFRAYAVGDVHGRLDLLDQLLARIEDDNQAREPRETYLIFLGDLIDRGPSSAQVIERLRTYQRPGFRPVFLTGNHEEVLLRLLAGEAGLLGGYLRFGGAECLRNYGIDPLALATEPESEALRQIGRAIPDEHRSFLESFADTFRFGDYLFVHAGIRPGIELSDQRQTDLRWIRYPFLEDETDHGFVVVHGHTIYKRVDERPNRIGIDTGAYLSGILTALAVEEAERWYIDTATEPKAA